LKQLAAEVIEELRGSSIAEYQPLKSLDLIQDEHPKSG
jgi:hypothetical protein